MLKGIYGGRHTHGIPSRKGAFHYKKYFVHKSLRLKVLQQSAIYKSDRAKKGQFNDIKHAIFNRISI